MSELTCQICGKMMGIITSSHLKSHQYTFDLYREKYPNSPLVGEAHKERLRVRNAARKGTKTSQETKNKLSALRKGRTHSQETKDKIGAGNKGKVMTQEAIEKQKKSYQEALVRNGGGFATGPRSQEFKDRMSEIAKARSPEVKAANGERLKKARNGWKASPEQRENYRAARIKYMTENPNKFKDTAGERQLKEWFSLNSIDFKEQWTIRPFGHPYDFYLPAYNTLVEFDGTHHWERVWFGVSGKTDLEKLELLEEQQMKDAVENLAAGMAGFRIIRIYGRTKIGDCPQWPDLETQLKRQGFHW